ncbi:hypothetical protein PTKIN_Ptkin04bG0029100 [Pterospermum kingtungense]
MERTLWGHLPLLVRSNSKESVEYILQSLWRTRKTGLDADDRRVICEMLQLQNDSDLDPVSLPRLKAMTWNMATQDTEVTDPVAVINLKLQNDKQAPQGEVDLKFQLSKETLDTMVKSMYCIRDQLSNSGETSNGLSSQEMNAA